MELDLNLDLPERNAKKKSKKKSITFIIMVVNLLAAGFLSVRLGEQGALLLGSKMQRWSSIRPRWPWEIIFMNCCCSSGDSAFLGKIL